MAPSPLLGVVVPVWIVAPSVPAAPVAPVEPAGPISAVVAPQLPEVFFWIVQAVVSM